MLRLHLKKGRQEARQRTIELLRQVEIPDPERKHRPLYFSNSPAACVSAAMIAMRWPAILKFLIADEPTTALDVTTQAEVLDLIARMQRELGMATR